MLPFCSKITRGFLWVGSPGVLELQQWLLYARFGIYHKHSMALIIYLRIFKHKNRPKIIKCQTWCGRAPSNLSHFSSLPLKLTTTGEISQQLPWGWHLNGGEDGCLVQGASDVQGNFVPLVPGRGATRNQVPRLLSSWMGNDIDGVAVWSSCDDVFSIHVCKIYGEARWGQLGLTPSSTSQRSFFQGSFFVQVWSLFPGHFRRIIFMNPPFKSYDSDIFWTKKVCVLRFWAPDSLETWGVIFGEYLPLHLTSWYIPSNADGRMGWKPIQ